MLASPGRLGVGRLGQMGLETRRLDLLDHIPPAGTSLHRQRHPRPLGTTGHLLAQPPAEPLPVRLPDPTPPLLTALHLERIERDLLPMQIQPTYHRHHGPPRSRTGYRQTERLAEHEPRGSSHIECLGLCAP